VVRGKLINLKGQAFGALTVIRRSYPWETPGYAGKEYRRKTRQARWVCQCICGGVRVMISQNLRKGEHKCNCKPLRHTVAVEAVPLNAICAEVTSSPGNPHHGNSLEEMAIDLAELTEGMQRELV
jgi:hypothetical protein